MPDPIDENNKAAPNFPSYGFFSDKWRGMDYFSFNPYGTALSLSKLIIFKIFPIERGRQLEERAGQKSSLTENICFVLLTPQVVDCERSF